MSRHTKILWIVVPIIVCIGTLGMFRLVLSPRNFSDLAFESRMLSQAEEYGVIDMGKITDFDWDTMYYSWNGYLGEDAVAEYAEDPQHLLRQTAHEIYNHLLFLKDGILVRQVIIDGTIKLPIEPYLNDRDEDGAIKDAKFLREDAVFLAECQRGRVTLRHE
ncbi:hypothetical protein CE91St36_07300 [Christensenellaceae bacterium]|nr:hypothetical protein CE91St36_07300 [Christensenellaceae bacterium]BDF60581.1 hypothetical protein CE91St37_07310 [Christensenellaceae bacterium]